MDDKIYRETVAAEVVKLATELYLPKGTEHFLSDLHGEYEAFSHIMRSASGVIRRKLLRIADGRLRPEEISELLTVVYYPDEKLDIIKPDAAWYEARIGILVELLASVSAKYTREKVRLALDASGAFGRIIFELLYIGRGKSGEEHLKNSVKTLLRLGEGESFVKALSSSIKRLAVDRLHIVGDIYDRGAHPDKILDELIPVPEIDIEWGNHDILWMGAAAGSGVCIMGAILNSLTYKNTDFLETGYGISLSALRELADRIYGETDTSAFIPKGDGISAYSDTSISKMRIAAAVIMWKSEGALIERNPDFLMKDRMLLGKINGEFAEINGTKCKLLYSNFPTLDKKTPYELTECEREILEYYISAFTSSERLRSHAVFLSSCGAMYKIYNRNLLFHGSIPMDKNGDFLPLPAAGGRRGRELMDYFTSAVKAALSPESFGREKALDLMWFLWCGKDSPLTGREKIASFERMLICDKSTHKEARNYYYNAWDDTSLADMILSEFGLSGVRSHIINGHIPVKRGESPIKSGGKLIVIDGGFCHAYHDTTGIAGYTLIYSSEGMRISAHEPFAGKSHAIEHNLDIHSETEVFDASKKRIRASETDEGKLLMDKIASLMEKL